MDPMGFLTKSFWGESRGPCQTTQKYSVRQHSLQHMRLRKRAVLSGWCLNDKGTEQQITVYFPRCR